MLRASCYLLPACSTTRPYLIYSEVLRSWKNHCWHVCATHLFLAPLRSSWGVPTRINSQEKGITHPKKVVRDSKERVSSTVYSSVQHFYAISKFLEYDQKTFLISVTQVIYLSSFVSKHTHPMPINEVSTESRHHDLLILRIVF